MQLLGVEPVEPARVAFRSRFGGFWTDLSNAHEILAGKRELGLLDDDEAALFATWIDDGCVILRQAVAADVLDRLAADVERAWRGELGDLQCEHSTATAIEIRPPSPEVRGGVSKLLNLHGHSAAARDACFAPPLRRFLHGLFERPALAMQSLLFETGTRQPPHQDSAYVGINSPMELVAAWIALEDTAEGSGKLAYYPGSHAIPETTFLDGATRLMPFDLLQNDEYYFHLKRLCDERGLGQREFTARRGDVLVWSADLVHGGSQDLRPGTTRRSLVVHYCPADRDPIYFSTRVHSPKTRHADGCHYCFDVR